MRTDGRERNKNDERHGISPFAPYRNLKHWETLTSIAYGGISRNLSNMY